MTPPSSSHVPTSTYRLQVNHQFTLDQVAELVNYLDDLGIGACYVSPLQRARPSSLHGYDIIDHSTLNPEVGGLDALQRLTHKLSERQLGLMLDVVPNHMCIADPGNRLWTDVLENGPSSPFANFFDIDWDPPKPDLVNKLLLPFLGDQYGRVLENQEIRVTYEAGAFFANYYDLRLPLEPQSWRRILGPVLTGIAEQLGEQDDRARELASTLTALKNLPTRIDTDPDKVAERQREKEIIKRRLAVLVESSAEIGSAIRAALNQLNGRQGDPRSFDALESLLADQSFRLSFWRVAADEINYRRFFDINELAAIRVEEPSVFTAVHELVLQLVEKGIVTGLRVDHVDGIADPRTYLEWIVDQSQVGGAPASVYVVVEKILLGEEKLRPDWPVAGTTGYDFLNLLNGVFIDSRSRQPFLELYRRLTGISTSFETIVYESKQLVLAAMMSSELQVLSRKLDRISEQHRWSRDFTFNSLNHALTQVIACFPAYRSYIGPADTQVSVEDQRLIVTAISRAKRRNPSTSATLFDFIGQILLLRFPAAIGPDANFERRDFVLRFQQLTAPVMAKGLEDTAFYRFYPLASQNEVGGDPQQFGISVPEFHRKCRERLTSWPHSLSATATHDTKRGEDVRARLNVLSELPEQWEATISRWRLLNQPKRRQLADQEVPGANKEYLLYQTLVGTWPLLPAVGADPDYVQRIQDYLIKASKEAKLNTSWINPDEEYEQALREFISAILAPTADNVFYRECAEFSRRIAWAGSANSLSQVLLKITAPGVPDFFQGTELWDLSLVDPDNRRPVDFALRRRLLATLHRDRELDAVALCARILRSLPDGPLKLYVMSQALACRRANAELFARGDYQPLQVCGERWNHIIAFARSLAGRQIVVVAARFFIGLGGPERLPVGAPIWESAILALPEEQPAAEYREVFTNRSLRPRRGGTIEIAEALAHLPIALLERQPGSLPVAVR